ncbi:MAG: hypothetical protein H7330_00710, partial [Hymenobacteraceae bacterium]|nr:hypothetical protein [Hymenobacteraceae bacterium]
MPDASPSSTSSPAVSLRLGLMVSGSTLSVWQADCVRQLLAVPGVRLALLIEDGGTVGEMPASTWQKIRRQDWRKLLFLSASRTFMKPPC